jgi:hypothetical protein
MKSDKEESMYVSEAFVNRNANQKGFNLSARIGQAAIGAGAGYLAGKGIASIRARNKYKKPIENLSNQISRSNDPVNTTRLQKQIADLKAKQATEKMRLASKYGKRGAIIGGVASF